MAQPNVLQLGRSSFWLFSVVAILVIFMGSLILNSLPNGPTKQVRASNCLAGEIFAGDEGVPCTMMQQKRGWPAVTSVQYTHIEPQKPGMYLPRQQKVCVSGCGSAFTANTWMLLGIIAFSYAVFKLWTGIKLERELARQEEEAQRSRQL
jgi:hypothetical protein